MNYIRTLTLKDKRLMLGKMREYGTEASLFLFFPQQGVDAASVAIGQVLYPKP
jgi:hypothetical protein